MSRNNRAFSTVYRRTFYFQLKKQWFLYSKCSISLHKVKSFFLCTYLIAQHLQVLNFSFFILNKEHFPSIIKIATIGQQNHTGTVSLHSKLMSEYTTFCLNYILVSKLQSRTSNCAVVHPTEKGVFTYIYNQGQRSLKKTPLMLTGYSLTLRWDCGLDLWSKERWWSPQLRSSPLVPPLSRPHRPAEGKRRRDSRNVTYIVKYRGQVVLKEWPLSKIKIVISKLRQCVGNEWMTFRCAATVAREVLVMRHRSAEPEVGCLALGSNSWPSWWRLNFCCPKPRALRFPLKMQRWHVWVLRSVWRLKVLITGEWRGMLSADK